MRFRTIAFFLSIALFSACKTEWTERDKEKIKKDCFSAAERFGFMDPEKHCDCVLRKIMQRYPSPNQFENMEMGEFGSIVSECEGQDLTTRIIWPEATQKAFVDSCTSMATQQGKKNARPYCECVLNELIRRYPTNDSISRINPAEMKEIGIFCEDAL
jgi:hypothetical protein